jgi:hypothetical protein
MLITNFGLSVVLVQQNLIQISLSEAIKMQGANYSNFFGLLLVLGQQCFILKFH